MSAVLVHWTDGEHRVAEPERRERKRALEREASLEEVTRIESYGRTNLFARAAIEPRTAVALCKQERMLSPLHSLSSVEYKVRTKSKTNALIRSAKQTVSHFGNPPAHTSHSCPPPLLHATPSESFSVQTPFVKAEAVIIRARRAASVRARRSARRLPYQAAPAPPPSAQPTAIWERGGSARRT